MKIILMLPAVMFAATVTGQSNYALTLNGTNQYISIGTPLSNNSSYTKEAWIYVTSSSSSRNIISSTNAPFWLNAGFLNAGHGGNYSQVVDPTIITLNKWTHVAVTYDAATTTMKLYRDGVLVNTATSIASNYTSEATYIGSHAGAGSYLQGTIDEVRIWNVARTQAQLKVNLINPPANNASGLSAYYKLNDASGTVATNSTGGTNGTLQNTPTWVTSPVEFAGNSLNFDGTNDVVSIPNHATLNITTAITLEAWVYATKNTGIQNVISKSSSSANNGYIFPRTDNGWTNTIIYFHIGGSWRTLSAAYPGLNAWHHLAATYDGATIKLYIDGVLSASQAQTGSITTNSNVLALGNQTGFTEFFGGSVDEVRIWNVARTQAQIMANKNTHLDPTAEANMVSNYTFNQGTTSGTNTGLTTIVDMKNENNGTLSNFALSGTTSNFIIQNAILPLQWLTFTAVEKNSKVLLAWRTAYEQNTNEFIIEHSTDGVSWNETGRIPAAGKNDPENTYSFLHESPDQGINYYRIVETDRDGKSSLSEIRTVTLNYLSELFVVIKNPIENNVLDLNIKKASLISLYSSDGRLIWKKRFAAGIAHISGESYSKGVYFLKSGGKTQKIILR
jgi:hypothetical protein